MGRTLVRADILGQIEKVVAFAVDTLRLKQQVREHHQKSGKNRSSTMSKFQLHHKSLENPKVETAKKLFRELYALCFWHLRPDLEITEETIPLIVKGLRAHGGKKGWLAAAQLVDGEASED